VLELGFKCDSSGHPVFVFVFGFHLYLRLVGMGWVWVGVGECSGGYQARATVDGAGEAGGAARGGDGRSARFRAGRGEGVG